MSAFSGSGFRMLINCFAPVGGGFLLLQELIFDNDLCHVSLQAGKLGGGQFTSLLLATYMPIHPKPCEFLLPKPASNAMRNSGSGRLT